MVTWTQRARTDLRAIREYIAEDAHAPIDARRVAAEIVEKVRPLADLPFMGKVVPEVNVAHLREISVYSWRIIYHVRDGQVFIVTLVHKRKNLQAEDIPQL